MRFRFIGPAAPFLGLWLVLCGIIYTMKLSRDEVRGLLEHCKLAGPKWSELFDREQGAMNESGLVYRVTRPTGTPSVPCHIKDPTPETLARDCRPAESNFASAARTTGRETPRQVFHESRTLRLFSQR